MKRITPTLFFALWGCTENQLHGPEGKAGAGGCETPVVGYLDEDGDGVGDVRVEDCVLPASAVDRSGDCDDQDPSIHPDASEWCDGVDQNCDGMVDEAPVDGVPSWQDADGDGYGVEPSTVVCPSDDVVDNEGQDLFAERAPKVELVEVAGAKHGLLHERDVIRSRVLDQLVLFLDAHTLRP